MTIQFAKTAASAPELRPVRTITITGWTTQELQLEGLSGDVQMQNSFVVRSDAQAGTLLVKLYSADTNDEHRVEALGKDEQDTQNAGSHPWTIDPEADSVMLLFNHSKDIQSVSVLVSGDGTVWQKGYVLVAAETKALSIRDLIDKATKDDQGKVIPKSAIEGQARWLAASSGTVKGRILQVNASRAMARNFSCGVWGALCGVAIVENTPLPNLSFGTVASGSIIEGESCYAPPPHSGYSCGTGSNDSRTTSGFSFNWSSANASVASIQGASTQSYASVYGAGGENSVLYGGVSGGANQCSFTSSAPVKTQVPTSLSGPTISPFVSYTNQNLYARNGNLQTSNFYGIAACGQYIVLDQNGQQIKQAGLAFDEKLVLSDYNHAYAPPSAPSTGSGATDTNFHLIDFYSDGGVAASLPAAYCLYYTQTIIYHPSGSPVRINCIDDLPRFSQPAIAEDFSTSANSFGVR